VTHAPAPAAPGYAPDAGHAPPPLSAAQQQPAAPAPSGLARWWTSSDSRKEPPDSRAPSAPRGEPDDFPRIVRTRLRN